MKSLNLNFNKIYYKFNINKNYFFFINYYYSFCFYKYNKINKSLFIKTINKKLKNFKLKSFYRDKNILIIKKYFNNSIFNGRKEVLLKYFNNFIKLFFFIFIKKNNYLCDYVNYNNIYDLVNSNKMYFDFNFFIKDFIFNYNSIFDIKIIKIPKKYKLKFKKKFNFEIKYVYKEKRLKFILKLINNFIKKSNCFNLSKKFFWLFVEIVFDPYNSFLWKRKINIYKKILKKFFKKNLV